MKRKLHVFNRREVTDKVIELKYKADVVAAVFGKLVFVEFGYIYIVNVNRTGRSGVHSAENVKYRSFTGSARTYYYNKFALVYAEAYFIDGFYLNLAHFVGLGYVSDLNKCHISNPLFLVCSLIILCP